jgi:hypothetical protein
MLQCHVVGVPDARVVELCAFDLILGHLLCRCEGGKGQESTSEKHVDGCLGRYRNDR